MADEIKLKAPTVEQQVVVNINGEDKLKSFADTLDKISNNKNLQKYWKTQQDLINATADAYSNFQKKASKDNASELIKVTNALKAMSGTDLSHILPDFDKISKSMAEAQKVAGNIDSAFSVKGFKEAFDSFETLKAYGADIQKLFSHFGVSSDIGELQQNVRLLEGEVEKLTRRLSNAKNANEELRNEFENFKVGSGFADKLDELDNLKSEMSYIREQAEETFNKFLELNNITKQGYDINGDYDDNRFKSYFENIQSGYYTASEAIAQFKSEYAYLLEDSFKSNNDTFGLDQLQAFSTKLDSIFHQVEDTSNKINDILSNGVIAKSVQNLSEDTTLSDSQRSIFGNILQDEESLKSITALFQKLIDETNQTKNTEVFNTEQFTKLESLFTSIESSLSSIKGVLVDVGDGEELSPLLKTVKEITTAVNDLNKSVSNIGFNVNIESGGMDQKLLSSLDAKKQSLLSAYKTQFDAMRAFKPSGATVAMANTENRSRIAALNKQINNFDGGASTDNIDQRITAFKEVIKLMKEVSQLSYGKDIYADMDSSFKNAVSSATGQVTRVQNELKKANIDGVGLENLFGSQDLSQVVEQLSRIADQFENIAKAASDFKTKFADGINVESSAKEIEKLTNRVKELEDELAKIKTSTVTASIEPRKDAIPSTEATASVEKTTQAIKEENNALEETANKAKQAVSELVKGRDVVSQNWYREKGTVIGNDSKGNDITRDADEFSFVERLKNGQLQTVLATYDEETGKWAEQVINVKTAFEQVEKAIISADNKIASLEMSRDKTLAAHSGYDTTADDNQIAIERKKRDELQNTLNLYGQEKEYVFEIEAANKRIADNQERLNNKKQSQTNLRQTVSEEQFLKDWDAAIAENNKRNAESAKQQAKPIKEEWTNAVKAVKEYESAVTKLNNLKAQDKGLGTKREEIEAQQKRIDELTFSFESARDTIISFFASTDKFNTLPTNSIKEVSDVLKLIGTAAQGSAESVAHLESETRKMAENTVDQYTNKISSYYEKSADYKINYDKFSSDGWASSEYLSKINQLNNEIEILDKKIAEVSEKKIVTKDDNDQLEQYKNNIESTIHELKTMPATQKGYTNLSAQKMLSKINQLLKDNSNMSKKAKNEIRKWYNEIASGNPTASLDVILGKVQEIVNAEIDAGRGGKGMWDAIKEKAWYGAAGTIGTYFGVSDIIRYGKQAVSTIISLDDALVDLKKTTTMSGTELNNFYYDSNVVAKQMGVTTKEIIDQASAWSRLGYNSQIAATTMAKLSSKFSSISPGMSTDEAQEGLVSIMKAFDIDPNDVETEIMDKINTLGNKFAENNQDVVEGLKRSAAAMSAMGQSFTDTAALFTGGMEILQDAESMGTALRTLSMRIRGYDEETEQLSDDLANVTGEVADLTKTTKDSQGVSLFTDATQEHYRSMVKYLGDISDRWDQISEKNQTELLQKLFGKNRANAGAAIIKNFDQVRAAIEAMEKSAGSADVEMSTIESSISYKINALKETWVGTVQELIDRGDIGKFVDGLTKISEALGFVIDKVGILGSIGLGAGLFAGFKNVGECNYISK